jgi:hypothetical protein
MRTRTLMLAALLVTAQGAFACINSVGTDHQGERFAADGSVGQELVDELTRQHAQVYWVKHAREIADKAVANPDFENLNNLAVALIYKQRHAAAIRLLLRIEKLHPGEYQTATNMGTALELAGYDAVALRWIRIGIARNRASHHGTEWLHARILDAKIAAKQDAGYFQRQSIAGIQFESQMVPKLPLALPAGNHGKPVDLYLLNLALHYQLRERLQFVPAPDPVVANLLLDWATLNLAGGPLENAQALYPLAMRYGADNTQLMNDRLEYIERTLQRAERHSDQRRAPCPICLPLPEAPPPPPRGG